MEVSETGVFHITSPYLLRSGIFFYYHALLLKANYYYQTIYVLCISDAIKQQGNKRPVTVLMQNHSIWINYSLKYAWRVVLFRKASPFYFFPLFLIIVQLHYNVLILILSQCNFIYLHFFQHKYIIDFFGLAWIFCFAEFYIPNRAVSFEGKYYNRARQRVCTEISAEGFKHICN